MVEVAARLDKHLIPDLANIVLEYCQLEHVDEVIDGCHYVYTKLFGKKHGELKLYYLTGELMYSCHYVNDKLYGESKGYYKNGELMYSSNWIDSKQHGEDKYYYPTGELMFSRHYADGVEQ